MALPFDYETVRELTSREEVVDSTIECRFTCPVSGRGVNASADLRATERMLESRSPWSTLGYSLAGALASMWERPVGPPPPSEGFSEAVRQAGVVRAFRSVSSLFRWDRERERWLAGDAKDEALTRFEEQLNVHPVIGTEDSEVLLRLLVAIAQADDGPVEPKRRFLRPFFPAGAPTPETLEKRPMPTAERLARIPVGRRESILMICWAAALCDENLGIREKELLEGITGDLEVSVERAAELRGYAQRFLLDRVVEEALSDFLMTIEEEDRVTMAGIKLGLPLAEIQNVIHRFKKRRGLAENS